MPQAPARLALDDYLSSSRWLLEAPLAPLQGVRFQPTGFPDIGAALFTDPDGVDRVLVESHQSMANHLEATVWDAAQGDLRPPLGGLSHVKVFSEAGRFVTSTWLEPHRLGSPRVLEAGGIGDRILQQVAGPHPGAVDLRALPGVLFALDVGSLVHGVFLQSLAGPLRVPRALGAFVEAIDVRSAVSGGVKLDPLEPSGSARRGAGHVVFHREEFVARQLRAFFSLDVAQIAAYRLEEDEVRLVLALALYEIRALLDAPLRLRSRCDLEVCGPLEPRPAHLPLPERAELEAELGRLTRACARLEPTEVTVSGSAPG